jgi:hypothetical protein
MSGIKRHRIADDFETHSGQRLIKEKCPSSNQKLRTDTGRVTRDESYHRFLHCFNFISRSGAS